jgi:hypothetical protein
MSRPLARVTTSPGNTWLLGNGQARHFTGSSWQHESIPALGQTVSVTAASADDIWALSVPDKGAQPSRPGVFFVHYDGRAWQRVALPAIRLPKHESLSPANIWAVSAHSVWAAVTADFGGSRPRSYLLHFDGRRWRSIALPVGREELIQIAPDGGDGVWAIMARPVTTTYAFAHYRNGKWSYDRLPTAGLPGGVSSIAADGAYALTDVPGTRWMLATGGIVYSSAAGKSLGYTEIFRYGS